MLSHEILENLKKLELHTLRLVDSFMVGEYFSIFKGRGLEFYEIREYQAGDDIRAIDWKTTARMGKPFVKAYVEERELPVLFLADMSGSMDFGSRGRFKRDLFLEVVAFLGMAAIKRNNPIGLITFADKVEIIHPAKKGRNALFDILAKLSSVQCSHRGTDISAGIDALRHSAVRKGLVFLLSDFMDADYESALKTAAKKYDIVPVVISDPLEETLPDAGFIEIEDSETGEMLVVDTSDRKFREGFCSNANKHKKERRRVFRDAGLDYIELKTDMPFTKPIRDFFYRRQSARI